MYWLSILNEGVVETGLITLIQEITNHTSMACLVPDLMLIGVNIGGQYRCSQKVVMFIILSGYHGFMMEWDKLEL